MLPTMFKCLSSFWPRIAPSIIFLTVLFKLDIYAGYVPDNGVTFSTTKHKLPKEVRVFCRLALLHIQFQIWVFITVIYNDLYETVVCDAIANKYKAYFAKAHSQTFKDLLYVVAPFVVQKHAEGNSSL